MGRVLTRIEWALAHPCPLRNPNDWHDGKVLYASRYSDHLIRYPDVPWVHEGIYSSPDRLEFDGKCWEYPAHGFSLDRRYPKQHGWKGLQMLCSSCPACSTEEIAGCVGSFMDNYYDEFWEIIEAPNPIDLQIEKLGIRTELARHFPVTNPLWFGFWINPILPAEGISLLRQIFAAMDGQDNHDEFFGLPGFLRALTTAEQHGLELHVKRIPYGTRRFLDPHCPHCTSGMFAGTNQTCKVCGHVCSPRVEKRRFRWRYPHKPLLHELGEKRFIELILWKLRQQEVPEELLDTLIEAILERERTRPEWEAEDKKKLKDWKERRRSEARFCKQVLFKGIRSPKRDIGQFRAPQFRKVLERCQKLGIMVKIMSHGDSDYTFASYRRSPTYDGVPDPFAQLEAWMADGCNEWFTADYEIPDALLSRTD